ncbi:uncharacterized protein HMPREF1541_03852 [Cyphellophora europaea CBS 101466]|uniref:Alpha-1,3-mannosyltransferase n=1 Tax=Cyphellophora europaea (strain CBS 101466) TaxID=1220924 RepID=W2S1K3_CYPE1|nr:uncharacterized protein HMPREF1541_03852 [Cyphellophora europaea CBS 101466]ETN41913.1 hypothetical protein HMPREF1541_03852 [Cyphellophora europaea CBS 101466]
MPPHLHPRSTATSTLFAGTLLASFVVVGIPHVFPCPRPRRQYLDADGKLQPDVEEPSKPARAEKSGSSREAVIQKEAAILRMLQEEARQLEQQARECPVPKPKGWVGRMLGFEGPSAPEQVAATTDSNKR